MKLEWRNLAPRELDHELVWSLVGLVAMGGVVGWVRVFGPPPLTCAFHEMTGLPCPTCGSTRALLALARLEVVEAFRLNPFCAGIWLAWGLFVPYGLAVSLTRGRRLRARLDGRDWLLIRIAGPLAAVASWVWIIVDGR